MDTLTISTLDEFTLSVLRQKAARVGKSPEQEAADLIREQLGRSRDPETLIARADAIAAMGAKGVVHTDSAQMIRDDRDR